MTTLQLPSRTAVRAAGLVDVPAVVRLIAPPQGPTPRGADAPLVDWEETQRVMRLMLAHHALEEGQVWVAERADGSLLAAAVWLPPGTGTEPPDPRFSSILSRELDSRPAMPSPLSAVLGSAASAGPHWTVIVVWPPDDSAAPDQDVVSALLAPGLRTVEAEQAGAFAVTVSARHVEALRPLGFHRPHEVTVAPGASLWLATREPRSLTGA